MNEITNLFKQQQVALPTFDQIRITIASMPHGGVVPARRRPEKAQGPAENDGALWNVQGTVGCLRPVSPPGYSSLHGVHHAVPSERCVNGSRRARSPSINRL